MARSFGLTPAVSVVVPAYNAACTLETTLASAFAQSVRDIEFIVVDDGSTDATPALLRQFADCERRLRLIHQRNGGVSVARNTGVLAARADIVAFLDADDLWPVDHLATHIGLLKQPPQNRHVSFSVARFVDAKSRVIGVAAPQLTELAADSLLRTNPTTTTSTWVVHRHAFDVAGLFDVRLRYCEDQEWLVRAALCGLTIEGTASTIVDYRVATGGLASDLDRMRSGFDAMMTSVASRAPDLVAACGRAAGAAHELYLSRQAVRLGLGRRRAWQHASQAVSLDPLSVVTSPRQTMGAMVRALSARGA
jgi:hypothetical protein